LPLPEQIFPAWGDTHSRMEAMQISVQTATVLRTRHREVVRIFEWNSRQSCHQYWPEMVVRLIRMLSTGNHLGNRHTSSSCHLHRGSFLLAGSIGPLQYEPEGQFNYPAIKADAIPSRVPFRNMT
jgi:hypothetical protein